MAVSKLIKERAENLYVGSGTYSNDIGTTKTLDKNVRCCGVLRLELFVASISSSTRRVVVINNMYNNISAAYFIYATPTGSGILRVEATGTSLTLLSGTENDMYLHNVAGTF